MSKHSKKYDEAYDGEGMLIHFNGPHNCNGVKGYRIEEGPSPVDHKYNEKRKRARAERKRLNKHKKRGR